MDTNAIDANANSPVDAARRVRWATICTHRILPPLVMEPLQWFTEFDVVWEECSHVFDPVVCYEMCLSVFIA